MLMKMMSNKKLLDIGWKKGDYISFEDGVKKICKWRKKR